MGIKIQCEYSHNIYIYIYVYIHILYIHIYFLYYYTHTHVYIYIYVYTHAAVFLEMLAVTGALVQKLCFASAGGGRVSPVPNACAFLANRPPARLNQLVHGRRGSELERQSSDTQGPST